MATMADDAAGCCVRSRSPTPTSPVFRRERHRTGACPPPSRVGSQPRPLQYLGSTRCLPTSDGGLLALAAGGRPERASNARGLLFLWIYTPRAHANGEVEEIIEETLAFPHPQSAEAFQAQPMPS